MNCCICSEKSFYEICRNANMTDANIREVIDHSRALIKVRYENPEFPTIHVEPKGNWIDLKCTQDYELKAGDSALINLGVAMKLPEGFEAYLAPRSGTFKKYGLMQTNSVGIIDNSYSGTNDIWKMPVHATRDTIVKKGERLCQFRLARTMESELFEPANATDWFTSFSAGQLIILEVDTLDDIDRGGFGSSGR